MLRLPSVQWSRYHVHVSNVSFNTVIFCCNSERNLSSTPAYLTRAFQFSNIQPIQGQTWRFIERISKRHEPFMDGNRWLGVLKNKSTEKPWPILGSIHVWR